MIGNECKIYQFKVNEKGIIEINEIDYKASKSTISIKGGQVLLYKSDLDKWRVSYMYSFDPDLDKAVQSLMESLREKIEKNRNVIESKMRANAECEKILEKLAENYIGVKNDDEHRKTKEKF